MTTAPNDETKGPRLHDSYPYLGKGPIPVEVFTSGEQFEREREHVFKKVWLNVGRVEQIPNPGDYFVKDLATVSLDEKDLTKIIPIINNHYKLEIPLTG